MESQNGSLEDDIPFQTGEVQVPCVSFQGDVVTKENITLLKGTTPLDDFRKKYICAFLPMELQTYARAKTPKPLELRSIFSFFFQVWKHGMLFFCARGIILCSGDGHLVDKAAFRTFWATD